MHVEDTILLTASDKLPPKITSPATSLTFINTLYNVDIISYILLQLEYLFFLQPLKSIMSINMNLSYHNHTYISIAHQLTQIENTAFSINDNISNLPRISIKRKSFVLREWLDKKKLALSWVNEYGKLLIEIGHN